jgi:hypothetical protein
VEGIRGVKCKDTEEWVKGMGKGERVGNKGRMQDRVARVQLSSPRIERRHSSWTQR